MKILQWSPRFPKKRFVRPRATGRPPTVLVIDDDPLECKSIRRLCRPSGIETFEAHGGAEGYWLAEATLPDVVVTDLLMPLVQGEEVVRALKESLLIRSIPVIIITGVSDEARVARARWSGASRVFEKPFEGAELLNTIIDLMNG